VLAVAWGGGLLPQHGDRGAHEVEHGGLQGAHLVPVARDAETLADRGHAAQQQSRHDGHDGGVEVEHRVRAVQHVVGPQLQPLYEQLCLREHEAVRDHGRLRSARGARGVEQQAQGVERHLGPRQGLRGGLHAAQQGVGWAALGISAHHKDMGSRGQLGLHFGPLRMQRGVHHRQAAFHQVDRIGQHRAAKRGVHRRSHGAQLGQREPEHRHLDAVGQHEADVVARAHALGMQAGGQAVALLVDLAVGPLARRHADERLVGHLGGCAAQLGAKGRGEVIGSGGKNVGHGCCRIGRH